MSTTQEAYKPTIIGQVSYNGCTMTYYALGNIKSIVCREGNTAREVATNLDEDTDQAWQKILAEAA